MDPDQAEVGEDALGAVVESLALGLRADGADLTATQSGRQILFTLHIPDEACAECVMPATVLSSMFQHRVDVDLGPGWAIAIDDPRERAGGL